MMLIRHIIALVAFSMIHTLGTAQDVEQTDGNNFRHIRIDSNVHGAFIFVDGLLRGATPLALDSLTPGIYVVKAVHPDISNWLSGAVRETIVVSEESKEFFVSLPQLVMINSNPSEADVVAGDSVVGQTPYLLNFASGIPFGKIALRKEGFRKEFLDPSKITRGSYFAAMTREWDMGIGDIPPGSLHPNGRHPHTTKLYITGATAILSGVASAYFKTKADNRFDDYLLSGDQGVLSEINRLDTRAGIALAVTQISTFLFVYFLLSE